MHQGLPQPQDWPAMAFKLMTSAQKKWRKLDGQNRLPEVIAGVEFRDGLRQLQTAA